MILKLIENQSSIRETDKILDGIVLLYKEAGDTSMLLTNRTKKKLKVPKMGHTGTLDPFASGLMILCVNNATKVAEIFQTLPKVYDAEFVFGEEKDSHDTEGKTVHAGGRIPQLSEIQAVLSEFTGKISQIPPIFSAAWVDGERAYNRARQGEEVELNAREVEVYDYQIIDYKDKYLKVRVNCSSGTYIRSLARDLGRKLGTYAFAKELKRVSIGEFFLENAKTLAEVSEGDIIPLNRGLSFLPSYELKTEIIHKVKNAVPLQRDFFIKNSPDMNQQNYFWVKDKENEIVAVLKGKKYYYINRES